jgi:hypothetical protein
MDGTHLGPRGRSGTAGRILRVPGHGRRRRPAIAQRRHTGGVHPHLRQTHQPRTRDLGDGESDGGNSLDRKGHRCRKCGVTGYRSDLQVGAVSECQQAASDPSTGADRAMNLDRGDSFDLTPAEFHPYARASRTGPAAPDALPRPGRPSVGEHVRPGACFGRPDQGGWSQTDRRRSFRLGLRLLGHRRGTERQGENENQEQASRRSPASGPAASN